MTKGLKFFDQNACALYGKVGLHGFKGMPDTKNEGEQIAQDIKNNFALVLTNYGLLTVVGRTIGETFTLMQRPIKDCDVHIKVLSTGAKHREIPRDIAILTAN